MKTSKLSFSLLLLSSFWFVTSADLRAQTPQSNSADVHVVASGETLFAISRHYDMSVAELMRMNGLSGSAIQVGQRLRVSNPAHTAGSTYVVRSGDTLWSIAKRHDTTVAELQRLNRLSGNGLSVGQRLVVSAAATSEVLASTSDADVAAPANAEVSVETGQTVTVEQGANVEPVLSGGGKLDPPANTPSVVIRVDDNTVVESFDVHTVKETETWESIADRYGMAVSDIKDANDGAEQLPAVGTQIRLPEDPTVFHYKVEEGDTIERIARWFTVDANVLRRLNDLEGDAVTPGQVLRIPDLNSPLLKSSSAGGEQAKRQQSRADASNSKAVEAATVLREGANDKSKIATDSDAGAAEGVTPGSQSGAIASEVAVAPAEETPTASESVSSTADDGTSYNRRIVRIYPESFKGRLMANGTAYNPKRNTISHATADFGAKVRVTNLSGGQSAFAIVTDRPLPGSTQVDMSRSLASELGIKNTRNTTVMVEIVD